MKTTKLLAIFLLSVFIISCGKDDDNGGNDDDNNPTSNIEYKELNYTISYKFLGGDEESDTSGSLSLLGNTLNFDFIKYVSFNAYEINLNFAGNAYFQQQTYIDISSTHQTNIITTVKKDSLISTDNSVWLDGIGQEKQRGDLYDSGSNGTAGIHGQGDVYVAFRVKEVPATTYRYGWIRINLSSDSRTLIIKDVALSKESNKAIKVGEK